MIRPRDIIRSIYTNYLIQMQVVKSEINLLHAIIFRIILVPRYIPRPRLYVSQGKRKRR